MPALKDYFQSCLLRSKEAKIADSALKLLFCEVLNCGLAELSILMGEKHLNEGWIKDFEPLFTRLLLGEPVQYIIGKAWFWGLPLKVSSKVLIPRVETEQLVELALNYCAQEAMVLDCCTGSGAIALALKKQRPLAEVHASDISASALQIAKDNASAQNLEIQFWECDLFCDASFRYDLIVSNPPYVSAAEYEALEPVVKDHEPQKALLSGKEGLDHIRSILAFSPSYLADGGLLCLEHGENQQQKIIQEATQKGWSLEFAGKDLAGRHRFLVFKLLSS